MDIKAGKGKSDSERRSNPYTHILFLIACVKFNCKTFLKFSGLNKYYSFDSLVDALALFAFMSSVVFDGVVWSSGWGNCP